MRRGRNQRGTQDIWGPFLQIQLILPSLTDTGVFRSCPTRAGTTSPAPWSPYVGKLPTGFQIHLELLTGFQVGSWPHKSGPAVAAAQQSGQLLPPLHRAPSLARHRVQVCRGRRRVEEELHQGFHRERTNTQQPPRLLHFARQTETSFPRVEQQLHPPAPPPSPLHSIRFLGNRCETSTPSNRGSSPEPSAGRGVKEGILQPQGMLLAAAPSSC